MDKLCEIHRKTITGKDVKTFMEWKTMECGECRETRCPVPMLERIAHQNPRAYMALVDLITTLSR